MLPLCSEHQGQHSMVLPAGQQLDPPRHTARERYGAVVCSGGYTALPNTVLTHYAQLGVSEGELVFIQQVWAYWWDAALPFPSVSTLAARMGKTVRQIQHYIGHLRRLGLLSVVERRDPRGGQLSNAYDLRPFLQAIEQLVAQEGGHGRAHARGRSKTAHPGAALKSGDAVGHSQAAGSGMQCHTPARMQNAAPETDPVEENPDSISISMPPNPRSQGAEHTTRSTALVADTVYGRREMMPATAEATSMPAPTELQATLARLGVILGDSAPCSSITRALRIQARYQLGERAFVDVLDEVGRRVIKAMPRVTCRDRVGKPNAMPYFFASVEASLAAARQAPPGNGPYAQRSLRVRREPEGNVDTGLRTEEPPDTGLPVWDSVRTELRETLAAAVFAQRVEPLHARLDADGALVLETPTPFLQRWVESRLRPRIEQILRVGGYEDVRVLIMVARPAESAAGASP